MFIRYIHFMLVKTIDKVPARFKLERKEFNSVVNSNSQKRWISVVKMNTAISYTLALFFLAHLNNLAYIIFDWSLRH